MDFLKTSLIETPVGAMIVVANEEAVHLLEFLDRKELQEEVKRLKQRTKLEIISGWTLPILSIKEELECYFKGELKTFETPITLMGTPFQQHVWQNLKEIPFGETRSYSDMAHRIGRKEAIRAVARANGANVLAIVVPCHRVIGINGALTGYGGGVERKKWLLEHERNYGK